MTIEELVPRPQCGKEFGRSTRTIKRWEDAKIPGFDRPIIINGRVFHPRSRIEAAKTLGNLLQVEGEW
jgi:hypothetical protein